MWREIGTAPSVLVPRSFCFGPSPSLGEKKKKKGGRRG